MCGIIGGVSSKAIAVDLLAGLKNMEYRGYDSAGICTLHHTLFECTKEAGKLHHLEAALLRNRHDGLLGIGHTRWATHGKPTVGNSHPHCSHDIAVVHNGIIENHEVLRKELEQAGINFASDTDTEVIPWMLSQALLEGKAMFAAMQEVLARLHGAYAIGVVHQADADKVWFARKGSPLLLARNNDGHYIASDGLAVAGLASDVMYLDEGDWGYIQADSVCVYNRDGQPVQHAWQELPYTGTAVGKGDYAHYMLKEIHEQPGVVANIVHAYADSTQIAFPHADFVESTALPERIVMVACGTSYHAALTARYWLERYLQIPVEVDVASEYRYRNPVIGANTWLITLSQSGETADTLEALRLFKRRTPDNYTLAICNVASSTLVRESSGFIELCAGPEIGVASTKAYTAQLTVLALFSIKLAMRADCIQVDAWQGHYQAFLDAVEGMKGLLQRADEIKPLVPLFANVHGALFLGRGPCYPLALEGALKLKEISYIHAEGYAAGEMKHGPIALIDEQLPVIVIAPRQYHLEKVISNLYEVKARGAKVILLTDADEKDCPKHADAILKLPEGDFFTAPLLASIPLQLLAYEVARSKGTDVDQPRNLAKSVTVE
ncbi:MAG: glutamine--fructose-6-phosphate transaminase (isomerizing) [Proteobacteria bacterium]|nr:glutamine--fructose-6-phosphate transaminase (isomerizing) [bacterium AH-315-G11]PCI44328.1 MAG: glutamine--fructose-6-phosphate transaminase (isomerizing) [Pseudomonadota bacterium]